AAEVSWRFSATAEDRYMAERGARAFNPQDDIPVVVDPNRWHDEKAIVAVPRDWTGFRGERRDGVARGVRVARTDWSENPPALLWKQRIGPGWSSFAVIGGQ